MRGFAAVCHVGRAEERPGMRCPRCRAANPADARFCAACGALLELVCPGCQTLNSPDSRFCRACGGVLAVSAPGEGDPFAPRAAAPSGVAGSRSGPGRVLNGERRQATVLFGEIAAATALAERLGPEAMLALVERFFELALGEVDRYDGTVKEAREAWRQMEMDVAQPADR
jgi:hypothetical protein